MTGIKIAIITALAVFGISIVDTITEMLEDIKEHIVEYIIPTSSSLYAFLNMPSDISTLSVNPYILILFKMLIAIVTAGMVATVQFFVKKYLDKHFKK